MTDYEGVPQVVEYLQGDWPDARLAGWDGPGWYFWTETWSYCVGPFKTKEEATDAAKIYGEKL